MDRRLGRRGLAIPEECMRVPRLIDSDLCPPMTMVAAIYSGILGSQAQPLQAQCPGSRCTWPATPSLAVCGECVPSIDSILGCPLETPGICNYTLPSHGTVLLTDNTNLTAVRDESQPMIAYAAVPATSGSTVFNGTADHRTYLARWYLIGAGADTQRERFVHYDSTECAL